MYMHIDLFINCYCHQTDWLGTNWVLEYLWAIDLSHHKVLNGVNLKDGLQKMHKLFMWKHFIKGNLLQGPCVIAKFLIALRNMSLTEFFNCRYKFTSGQILSSLLKPKHEIASVLFQRRTSFCQMPKLKRNTNQVNLVFRLFLLNFKCLMYFWLLLRGLWIFPWFLCSHCLPKQTYLFSLFCH